MAEYQMYVINVSVFVVDVNIRIRIIVVRNLLKYAASASNFVSVDGRKVWKCLPNMFYHPRLPGKI